MGAIEPVPRGADKRTARLDTTKTVRRPNPFELAASEQRASVLECAQSPAAFPFLAFFNPLNLLNVVVVACRMVSFHA